MRRSLRPAHLPLPHRPCGAAPQRLAERAVDKPHAPSCSPHDLGRGGVFGDLGTQRLDATRLLQIGAAPQHGLALREAEADAIGGVLPARLVGVEEGALDLGPEALRHAADRRRAQETGVGAPAGEQAVDIVGRHQHIAVGHHHPVVARGAPALDQVVELGVGGDVVATDKQARRTCGCSAIRRRITGTTASFPSSQHRISS